MKLKYHFNQQRQASAELSEASLHSTTAFLRQSADLHQLSWTLMEKNLQKDGGAGAGGAEAAAVEKQGISAVRAPRCRSPGRARTRATRTPLLTPHTSPLLFVS